MKRLLLFLLLSPALAWAQKTLVIEGPNDKVAPVVLQVKTDFDQDKGILTITMTGDDTAEANALWLLQDNIGYSSLDKYAKQQEGKLSVSSFAKEQISFMNLKEKTAETVIHFTGASPSGKMTIQTKEGIKTQLQKQILPLDNRSTLSLNVAVDPNVETVTLTLKNPLLLYYENNRYELSFIGNETSLDIDVVHEYCTVHAELLTQLNEYLGIFGEGEETLQEMSEAKSNGIDKVKTLLVNEITHIDLKRFENTKCKDIDEALVSLKDLIARIKKFDTSPKSGSGSGSGGAGQASSPIAEDCNIKKTNEDLKAAVVKMNTYANDWMSASDAAIKQAKKLAFDSLVKETDAKINALAPACLKKVDATALKNYEMAKKLVKN